MIACKDRCHTAENGPPNDPSCGILETVDFWTDSPHTTYGQHASDLDAVLPFHKNAGSRHCVFLKHVRGLAVAEPPATDKNRRGLIILLSWLYQIMLQELSRFYKF